MVSGIWWQSYGLSVVLGAGTAQLLERPTEPTVPILRICWVFFFACVFFFVCVFFWGVN